MTGSRTTALAIVAAAHVGVFALLALYRPDIIKKIVAPIQAAEVKEEAPPPEEPPPPPPKDLEIPPYVPPPEVSIESAPSPSPITVQSAAPNPAPVFTPPAPPQPAAPPQPSGPTRGAVAKGNQSAFTTEDYPDSSQRNGEEGTTVVSYTVSVAGRASNCSVTSSSNFPRLDARTCELIVKRFRFEPALQNGQPIEATKSQRVVWKIPKDR